MEWARKAGREEKRSILFSGSSAAVLPARAGSSHQPTNTPAGFAR